MAKSFTDIEQSKKLAEILPIESADMWYDNDGESIAGRPEVRYCSFIGLASMNIPCWSLAALLDVLSFPQLSKDKLGSGKVGWMVSVYPNDCRYDSCWHDNPIDTCVEMINKLKEKDLL